MPKDYLDIEEEYKKFKQLSPDTSLSLPDFAKLADEHDPAGPQRQSAYHSSGVVRGAKVLSGLVDAGFQATGIPQIAGEGGEAVGGALDRLIGTDKIAPTLKSVGESAPRMFTEAAATGGESLIPKILGYGASALGGTARTDSPIGGLVSAGGLGVMNKYLPKVGGVAERGLQDFLKGGTEEAALGAPQTLSTTAAEAVQKAGGESLIQPRALIPFAGRIAAETATGGAIGEAQRQAEMSVGPNKVGLTDAQRNPFTVENVIGQVASAIPMVGAQLLRRPANLNISSVKSLNDWLTQHEQFVKQDYLKDPAAYEGEADPVAYQEELGSQPTRPLADDYWTEDYVRKQFDGKTLDEAIKPDAKDRSRYGELFRIQLDNLDQARKEGRQDAVQQIEKNLEDLKMNIGSQQDLPGLAAKVDGLDAIARMAPPESPKGFAKFIQDVNQTIDDLNENTLRLSDKEKTAQTEGETWHPSARSSEAVNQLGLLKPITEEWLAKQYDATFDHSGNPNFAYRVVLQKVANHVLNHVDEALQRRSQTQVETEQSPRTQLPSTQKAAIEALLKFPAQIRDQLAQRTVEMWSHPGRDTVLPGGKTKKFFPERGWNRALVQAAQTYNPETGTVTISLGKKGPETFKLETLFAKDAKGNWVWEPPFKDLLMSEGRKREGEVSLEGMQEKGVQTSDVGEDEAAFHSAEQAEAADFLGKKDAGQQLGGLSTGDSGTGPEIPQPESTSQPSKFEPLAQKTAQTVAKMDDKTLWGKVKDLFVRKSALGVPVYDPNVEKYNTFRQKTFKTALKVALEDLQNPNQPLSQEAKNFVEQVRKERGVTLQGRSERNTLQLILEGYFGSPKSGDVLPEKVSSRPDLQKRLYQVLEKVVGKEEMQKLTEHRHDASVAPEGDQSLVTFSGPVRLRKWLANPTGAYTPSKEGTLAGDRIVPLLRRLGLSSDELQLYNQIGLLVQVKKPQVKVSEVADWLEKNVPKVEVKKLQPSPANRFDADSQRSAIQHQFETKGYTIGDDYGEPVLMKGDEDITIDDLPSDLQELARKYASLTPDTVESASDAATGRYGVEPKELKDMPGAVDILVRLPVKSQPSMSHPGQTTRLEAPTFRGPHFGDSDENVLASVRGYEETLPNGEKAFHVFEVQSDWGQKVGQQRKLDEEYAKQDGRSSKAIKNWQDHPLLAVYEQLALKAAIDHAREIGAKYVALSDAETAMMTEGHDRSGGVHIDSLQQPDTRIPQEPGMRAAYDQRLPQTMEKLTGQKGQNVDFGINKNVANEGGKLVGSPAFNNKTNITARLYDISSTRPKFAAFGYTDPAAGLGTASSHNAIGEESTFRGAAWPGQFANDVTRTFRDMFKRRLSADGYSGSLLDTYTEMATAIALTKKDAQVDFRKLTSPYSGLATSVGNRAMVGVQGPVNLRTDAFTFVNDTLRTLAHELVHVDQYILSGRVPRPDAMSDEEYRSVNNMQRLADALSPEERASILKSLNDGIVPKQFQVKRLDEGTQMPYGSNKSTEFVAEVSGMLMQSLMGGSEGGVKRANEVLDFMPQEVIDYTRGKYRAVGDILTALKDTIKDPRYREFAQKEGLPAYSHFLGEALETSIQTARNMSKLRDPDFIKSAVQQHLASLSPGALESLNTPTDATWTHRIIKRLDPEDDFRASVLPTENGREAIKVARQELFGDKTEKGSRPGIWSRYLYPFTNLVYKMERAGVPLARDVWHLTQDLHPAIGRFQSSMLEPFLTRDKNGKLRPDDAGLLLTKLNKDRNGPWRQVFNQVRAFQNEHESKPMFVQGEKGLVVDDSFKTDWERMSRSLSLEDQQVVMNMSTAMDKVYQTAATHLTGGLLQSIKNRTAALLMQMNKGMPYDQAQQMAAQLVADSQQGRPYSVKMTPEQAEQVGGLLGGADGLLQKWAEVSDHLASRPGYSSERLPGDWVIRFKTPEGETKYLGARDQRHAELLAGRLQHEGNTIDGEIINKKDVDKYTNFDSPDDVLSKFIEVESKSWEGFLSRYAAKNGQAAADELRSAFVPGESTAKSLETKGLQGFLKERESKVDRSRFDYLDAMHEYVGKMSTSLVYRSIKQQLNLILNDPRGFKYPTFKKLVSDQFDYMMSPNPKGLQELKGLTTAYFLGANLSSAIVEGTQSATTLVPTLLRTATKETSPVAAYGTLSKSISDLFRFSTKKQEWNRLAKSAEGKDPSVWSESESIAALYQRAVKDGLVELGVINDPDYGRDQRAIWTSRFGHGDYGPQGIGEVARNKVYVAANQLMRLYSFASTQNNKLSILAGLRQGYAEGLRGDALYRHAQLVKSLSTFGGGKANAPGISTQFNSPLTRTAWGLASTLQQYGFGTVATFAELGREALGQAKGLSGLERRQAQKAFGTMLITQLAVGGAMSLPFAAAAIALLEKQFGVQAGAAVRQGLSSLAGDDEELGSMIADTALSGLGNQLTGLDISSRAGVSNLFGTSAYNGFNAADVFGPIGSIVSNAVQSLNLFGQNEPLKAAKSLVPVAFKTPFDMLDSQSKYGDMGVRDQSGSLLYQPTSFQTAAMMLGFRPKQASLKRTAQRQLALSQQVYDQQRGQVLDQAATDLLSGNPGTAQRYVMDQYASDPTTNRRELYRSILDRAGNSLVEKDLTAGGSYGNAANVHKIAGSFGPDVVPKRSEVDLLKMKLQLASQLGPEAIPDDSAFDRAVMMDGLMQRGMTRSEASRMIEFLNQR